MNDWHPILAAIEYEPGSWRMVAQHGRIYGEVQFRRINGELGYRAYDRGQNDMGVFPTLRDACAAIHRVDIAAHGHRALPNDPRGHGAPPYPSDPDMRIH